MDNLIQAFFERDLTPAESEQLARLLETPGADALLFAGLGAEAYKATGLPAHHWPGQNAWPWHPGGAAGHSLFTWALAAAGFSGLATWWLWPKPGPLPQATTLPQPKLSQPAATLAPSAPRPAKPLPAIPGLEGRALNVEVDVPKPTLVTVRVLDGQALEVRHLYTGFLKAGHWRFAWDGLLSKGKPALPGRYVIQVQSDNGTLAKNVDVAAPPSSQP